MASPNDEVVPNPSKIFGLISIFIASLVAAYFPSASARFSTLRLPDRTLFYAKHFGTGVILSTSSTHLLGVTFDKLAHVRWLGYKNWPGFFVMVSLMAIFIVEYASNAYLAHYHTRCEADHEINTFMNGAKSSLQNGHTHPASDDEAAPLLGRDGCITGEVLTLKRRERTLGVLILQIGIMLHSFVIGLTMAVASAQRFAELVPAIFFHQVFEGIALGVRLASLTKPPEDENADSGSAQTSSDIRSTEPRFVPSRTERILPPLLSFLFAIPIPLILFVSLFVPPFAETSSIAPSIFSLNNPTLLDIVGKLHSHSETMQGITSAVSAGLLIYVSCVELLAADFLNNAEMQRNPASVQSGAIVAFAAGAVGMAFI